jgi:hypothetical protein
MPKDTIFFINKTKTMRIYTIRENDKIILEFSIPSDFSDFTLRDFIQYEVEINKTDEWFRNFDGNVKGLDKNKQAVFLTYMAKLLSVVTKVDFNKIVHVVPSHTLILVWTEIHKIFKSYSPQLLSSFEYKGEVFIVPERIINAFTGQTENPNLSSLEVITTLQYESILERPDLVKDGSRYNKLLAITATLCRKNLEFLPFDSDQKLNDFVSERMEHFKDLPAQVALNVEFFFINSLGQSKKIRTLNSFLRVLEKIKTSEKQI